MLQKEYRIPLPLTCEEYKIGQLYSVGKSSNMETKGDAGVEVLVNEPYTDAERTGQYTHKIMHLGSRLPGWVAAIAPKNALKLEEKAWNAFPWCRTELSNPMLGEKFTYRIESMHFDNDIGTQDNVFGLDAAALKNRQVEIVDIANSELVEYKEDEDPSKFKSTKTERGPLVKGEWFKTATPVMCCYKLVTVEFKWWGLQTKMQNFMMSFMAGIFARFHRQLFCWIDEWHGMTIEDIREFEKKVADEMNAKVANAPTASG